MYFRRLVFSTEMTERLEKILTEVSRITTASFLHLNILYSNDCNVLVGVSTEPYRPERIVDWFTRCKVEGAPRELGQNVPRLALRPEPGYRQGPLDPRKARAKYVFSQVLLGVATSNSPNASSPGHECYFLKILSRLGPQNWKSKGLP